MAAKVVPFKRPYFTIDNDLIDVHAKTIGAYGIAIYTYLRRRMKHSTRQCWPSVKTIAEALDIAETTVKVYLKKLVNVGLIASQARWDTAGDPTSNLYTFPEHVPAETEGGGSPDNPPWVGTQPTRGSAYDHKQSEPPEQKEKNDEKLTRAEDRGTENPQQTPMVDAIPARPHRQLCAHPLERLSHFGDIAVCQHCWMLLEDTDEGQARRADETPTMPAGNPCAHPVEQRSHFGDITVCQHCWSMLKLPAQPDAIGEPRVHREAPAGASAA